MANATEKAVILIPVRQPDEAFSALRQALAGYAVLYVDGRENPDGLLAGLRVIPGSGDSEELLKTGLRYLAEASEFSDFSYVVTATENSEAEDVLRAAETICETDGLLLCGRRSSFPTRTLFRIASGKALRVPDAEIRAFPMEQVALYASVPGKGERYAVETLFAALNGNVPVTEIETAPNGRRRNGGRENGGASKTLPSKATKALPAKTSKTLLAKALRQWTAIFLASRSLKYLFSSGVAFLIDYTLLLVLAELLPFSASMEIAAAAAWVVSSLTNFFLNRNFVFRSREPLAVALPEYYGLAGAVFLLKTYVLLELLTRALHFPLRFAKLLAEVVFFVSNYFIQKKFIFR